MLNLQNIFDTIDMIDNASFRGAIEAIREFQLKK